jgi:hypothetical protein
MALFGRVAVCGLLLNYDYEAGKLKMEFDVTQGLENTLEAYERLITGKKVGKSLVQLTEL